MKLKNNKTYIIVEIIPTSQERNKGNIAQLSALKIKNLKLIDRFDYRLNTNNINNPYILEMINYDKNNFIYKNTTEEIEEEFKKWIKNNTLLILDNKYTNNYLEYLKNDKESITDYYELEYSYDVIEKIKNKYSLEDSNYIVDLLYEALIYESNKTNR